MKQEAKETERNEEEKERKKKSSLKKKKTGRKMKRLKYLDGKNIIQ